MRLKNKVPIVQMRYIDWKYYEELNGLFDIMGFRYNCNKEILAQFHCSYFFDARENTITWTTQGAKYSIDYLTFSRLLGLDSVGKFELFHAGGRGF
jgi:hypothetical protein